MAISNVNLDAGHSRPGDGRDVDWGGLALRVIAGQRSPDDRNVDASVGDGIDDVALRIGRE